MRGNARACRQRDWSVYTERLATYCVEIREFDEVVVGKVRLIAVGFGEAATAVNNAAVAIDPEAHVFPGHSSDA